MTDGRWEKISDLRYIGSHGKNAAEKIAYVSLHMIGFILRKQFIHYQSSVQTQNFDSGPGSH